MIWVMNSSYDDSKSPNYLRDYADDDNALSEAASERGIGQKRGHGDIRDMFNDYLEELMNLLRQAL